MVNVFTNFEECVINKETPAVEQ